MANPQKEQRCHFLIGPAGALFMPNTIDIWSQRRDDDDSRSFVTAAEIDKSKSSVSQNDVSMDSDYILCGENSSLSYFVYGSIGCFCYGEIYHHNRRNTYEQARNSSRIGALINRLIEIKDDNTRVSSARFLRESPVPLIMISTVGGSLIIHDCLTSRNLIHFKKAEVLTRFVDVLQRECSTTEHGAKRHKVDVTQQLNSCSWPNSTNIFVGVSLLKENTCFVLWLKTRHIHELRSVNSPFNKTNFVSSYEKLEIDVSLSSSPICLLESGMIDTDNCVVAVARDDGPIFVLNINLESGSVSQVVKLLRHKDQICSMSLLLNCNRKSFQMGLLASVSRDGLVVVWDIGNKFCFADYQAISEVSGKRLNWFALTFVPKDNHNFLLVSSANGGISTLEVPERSNPPKVRLRDLKVSKKNHQQSSGPRHYKLLFNIEFDQASNTIFTSSLDGNHILWDVVMHDQQASKSSARLLEPVPQFLYPTMSNNARSHMLRFSPIKEELICCALGKAGLRFYRVGESPMNFRFDMTPSCLSIAQKFNQNASGKSGKQTPVAPPTPTSIAWHPSHEYRLAIGTLEGRVMRVDITPGKGSITEAVHKPVLPNRIAGDLGERKQEKVHDPFNSDDIFGVDYQPLKREDSIPDATHSALPTDGVYSLAWGPNPASPEDYTKHALYAVGSVSHRLFIYYDNKQAGDTMSNYLDEFLDQSLPEAIGEASEVAWKSSMDLMALGTTTGKIIIVRFLDESHADRSRSKLFKRLAVIQGPLDNTYVQCLAWHPTTDKNDSLYYYLATSSNTSAAFVFNLRETILVEDVKSRLKIEAKSGESDEANVRDDHNLVTSLLSVFVHKMSAHQKAISDICWNPHQPYQLATASFDKSCYVWSLENAFMDAHILSSFSARDRLFTVEWSLSDEDLIFTSGHDSVIWAWRPSENRPRKCE